MRRLIADLPRRVGYVHGPRLMSRLRKWWVLARNPHATVRFTEPVYLGPGFSLHMPDGGSFIAGPACEFRRNFRAEISGDGRIEIGAGTVFTYDVVIQCSTSIAIGERCLFGQATLIVDGNHRYRDLDRPTLAQGYDYRPIRIADDAAIMTKCTIIADVGERCFVGANSVVTKPVPPYTVVAGVPARVLDYFGPAGGDSAELGVPSDASG
jgi:acetyltransferase-like isoleucine patch superfamily enzyme